MCLVVTLRSCRLIPIIFVTFSALCNVPVNIQKDTLSTESVAVNSYLLLSKEQKWRNPHTSLRYADQALMLAEKIRYTKGIAEAQNSRGFCFWSFGDNDLAVEAAMEALKIAQHERFPLIEAESYYTLARGYLDVQDDTKARESIEIAKNLAREGKDWELLCSIYNLLGVILFVEDKTDSALHYYSLALSLGKEHGVDPVNFARIVSNIGECYANENPELAFNYFEQATSLAKETGNTIAEASIADIVGHALIRRNKLPEAEAKLLAALGQARILGLRRVIRHAYSGLVEIKLKQGRGDEAVVYLKRSYAARDSLINTSKIRQIVELESRYELQLKEQNIRLLESEKSLQALWTNVLIALVFLLVLTAVGVYLLQRYRHRKNRELLNLEIDLLTQRNKESEDRFRSALVPQQEIETQDQKILKQAISIVEKNIGDKLFGVDKMAADMNMSRTSLHRKIKSITGFAPGELIRDIRLRKAARLIGSRADSVTQIAQMVGFDDYSYFSKSFKKHFGVAPTQYGSQTTTPAESG